jgi:hypothetical protein
LLQTVHFSNRNLLCDHLRLYLVVRHVPGKLNVLADYLSRTLAPVNTEWELLQSVFQAITFQWGSPHVDLFATSREATRTDIASLGWDEESFP